MFSGGKEKVLKGKRREGGGKKRSELMFFAVEVGKEWAGGCEFFVVHFVCCCCCFGEGEGVLGPKMGVGFVSSAVSVLKGSGLRSEVCGRRLGGVSVSAGYGRCRSVVRMVEAPVKSSVSDVESTVGVSKVGLVGLAVMGQNLALNVAEKGFPISVYNRSSSKTDDAVERAGKELENPETFRGFHDIKEFVQSLERPRRIIMLVKAGKPVDATIEALTPLLEDGDMIIDGGNEWYENTLRRSEEAKEKNILYMGMGVSGGEEGARNGPSLMPGGPKDAWDAVAPILKEIAAQVDDGPCVFHIGPGGAGNYVKMIHNGIEYGDMQLIGEAYDILQTIGGLTEEELAQTFDEWNAGELQSFLIEITSQILKTKDDVIGDGSYLVRKVLDKTGAKGTGMWTMEEAVRRGVPAPTIAASLDGRYLSGLKEDRLAASKVRTQFASLPTPSPSLSRPCRSMWLFSLGS